MPLTTSLFFHLPQVRERSPSGGGQQTPSATAAVSCHWSATKGMSVGAEPTTSFVSGALAGVVSRTCVAPLDRLNTILQSGRSCAVSGSRSVLEGVQVMYRGGGVQCMFQGNSANTLKSMPEVGIKFLVFEQCSTMLGRRRDAARPQDWSDRLLPGAVAGMASQSIIYPLEVAKTRMSLAPLDRYESVQDCLREVVRREGPLALTRGMTVSLLGIVPFCAIDLALYSTLKEQLAAAQQPAGVVPSSLTLLACGACSSTVAQVVTYPLALVRTVMQVEGCGRSVVEVATRVWASGGIRAFYRGLVPNMLKAVPSLAIGYLVYEESKKLLARRGCVGARATMPHDAPSN